jgi:hypothetical protein
MQHLVEKKSLSDLCDQYGLQPSQKRGASSTHRGVP